MPLVIYLVVCSEDCQTALLQTALHNCRANTQRGLERVQQLRAFTALTKDPDLVPSTPYINLQPSELPILGDLVPSSHLLRHWALIWYEYMQIKHTQNNEK